jgi:hypothetical protein
MIVQSPLVEVILLTQKNLDLVHKCGIWVGQHFLDPTVASPLTVSRGEDVNSRGLWKRVYRLHYGALLQSDRWLAIRLSAPLVPQALTQIGRQAIL